MAKIARILAIVFFALCTTIGLEAARLSETEVDPVMPNFYAFDVLEDGEVERRFSFNGIALKETAAVFTLNGTKEGAVLRQMTDGRHLIQLIYDADLSLQDCEYITDTETALAFQEKLTNEYRQLSSIGHNTTIRIIEKRSDLPEDLARSTVYRRMKAECRQLHSRMRKAARQSEDQSSVSRRKRDIMMMPGTIWCGSGHRATQYKDLGAEQAVDRCCRRHDHCPETIKSKKSKYDITNNRPITISACDCDERRRREADDLYIVPHTKWCGKGNRADGPSNLGGYAAADRCCRQHDMQCPQHITAWSEKFGLYNSRPYTAMHCTCDDRFRSCLKQANTAASNLVGKLFFNIIQIKCFVLKPEKVCKKSSWWGKCTQNEWRKRAHLRDPIPY
ncbi:group 3 secretory phospholipase A2-like isoform X1 [Daphnia carinata]|uniref:group 3 secretory phospholipase A2-like isoform X1 n=1 Tax=Daphnia carinata TaxID=120202 RepID=UPI00257B478F|nr:group 3 secretory phospholipase A2-like isoform X1 [Daphnia carinata]